MTTTNARPWALITGASAGIGAVFARKLAARGMNCVLVARRKDKLEELAAELRQKHSVEARVLSQDLGLFEAPRRLLEFTDAEGLEIETLINNAGFGSHGEFCDLDAEWEMRMLDVNCRALVGISRMYAPRMRARRKGRIMHLASVASFQPCPYMATYGATKAFILMFSEALRVELMDCNVNVTALCPGPTQSEFFQVAKFGGEGGKSSMSGLEPTDIVVERGLAGLEANKPFVVSGLMNYLKAWSNRLVPRAFSAMLAGHILKPEKH